MTRPTRYLVEWEDHPAKVRAYEAAHGPITDALEVSRHCVTRANTERLADAKRVAHEMAEHHDTLAIVYERVNLHRLPRLDLWSWDDLRWVCEINGRAR